MLVKASVSKLEGLEGFARRVYFWLIRVCVTIFVITLLFPRDDPSWWVVQSAWEFRDLTFLPFVIFVEWVGVLFGVATVFLIVRNMPWFTIRAASTVLSQIIVIATLPLLALLFVQPAYAAVAYFLAGPRKFAFFSILWLVLFVPTLFVLGLSLLRMLTFLLAAGIRTFHVLTLITAPYTPFARGRIASIKIGRDSCRTLHELPKHGVNELPKHSVNHLLLVSDTHVPSSPEDAIIGSDRGYPDTCNFLKQVTSYYATDPILHAGDVTDCGGDAAWALAGEAFRGAKTRLVVAPGNHDIHFAWAVENIFSQSYPISDVAAGIRRLWGSDALRRRWSRGRSSPFPELVHFAAQDLYVLVLDSNKRPPSTILTNALGLVGPEQLQDSRQLLADHRRGGDLVILLHHHIFSPIWGISNALLRCLDAENVLEFALDQRACAILHGHKHMPYVVRYADRDGRSLVVVSSGSAHHPAIGPYPNPEPCCHRIGIAAGRVVSVELVNQSGFEVTAGILEFPAHTGTSEYIVGRMVAGDKQYLLSDEELAAWYAAIEQSIETTHPA